ncbi:MAG: hypothetical protein A3F54_05820 [Candidatus Kerfeldbacteria bacterium RIFCSPHIGHO2_12_FULL_48_17]|uniref:Uncharacterized protein n=1 Tax=Candidatus Kerfeldbacteria bacterium RIFCSPHIGHO2_12_FULL_48_17 TaxID=1798542 RepID=A0A1G2AZV7_9BACT|nr:MAG: hypothetical protein A3F54_05820 [Candidatus Kerfeldbacteria bacterium RIFCSPHIGHO2_12_FULL_48_17]
MEEIVKYEAWSLVNSTEPLHGRLEWQGQTIKVPLEEAKTVLYEGYYPQKPNFQPEAILTGICLWDARWQIFFKPYGKGSPVGARKKLGLQKDREEAIGKLVVGRKIEGIQLPSNLSSYHIIMCRWIGEICRQEKITQVFCQIPDAEYHIYIKEVETALGAEMPVLHQQLDVYSDMVKAALIKSLDGVVEVTWLQALQAGASNPQESYIWPYAHPEKFGMKPEKTIAVEDLTELKIFLGAEMNGKSRITSVKVGVLGIPYPYRLTEGETMFVPF